MADKKIKSARAVAVQVLNRCDPEKNYAGPILDKLLGKTEQHWLALRSTYNAEGDLLPVLERLGLVNSRVRLLSGDTELFLSAHFVRSNFSSQ